MSEARPLVIYHGDCRDGFCAAWIAWRAFGDDAEYTPAGYGKPAPDVAGREVFVLDFSYPYEETMRLIESAASFTMLDHHKTAQVDLERLLTTSFVQMPRIVFDMERSGAGIARDVLQPGFESWLVDYVQDRDLWRFHLLNSKAVNAYIGTLPLDFAAWDEAHAWTSASEAANLGMGAEAYKAEYVRQMQRHAIRQTFAGYDDIPVVNAPYVGISELVGALAEQDGVPFAVGWFQRGDGKVVYSLRSRGDFDVSALAQKFGGGGHKNAAGFQCEANSLARFVR